MHIMQTSAPRCFQSIQQLIQLPLDNLKEVSFSFQSLAERQRVRYVRCQPVSVSPVLLPPARYPSPPLHHMHTEAAVERSHHNRCPAFVHQASARSQFVTWCPHPSRFVQTFWPCAESLRAVLKCYAEGERQNTGKIPPTTSGSWCLFLRLYLYCFSFLAKVNATFPQKHN